MEGTTFRDWLTARVGDDEGQVSRRELARRLAEQAPGDGDPDSYRSSLRRILRGDRVASQPTRDAIQRALGDDTAPSVEDEAKDEPITRELVIDRLRDLRRDTLVLERALLNGGLI